MILIRLVVGIVPSGSAAIGAAVSVGGELSWASDADPTTAINATAASDRNAALRDGLKTGMSHFLQRVRAPKRRVDVMAH
jgi:hypothetical protein